VCSNNRGFAAAYLHRLADRRYAVLAESLHFLVVMDQRAEASDRFAVFESFLDHLDCSFDSKTKPVFIS
jgi:hypothetical protein